MLFAVDWVNVAIISAVLGYFLLAALVGFWLQINEPEHYRDID